MSAVKTMKWSMFFGRDEGTFLFCMFWADVFSRFVSHAINVSNPMMTMVMTAAIAPLIASLAISCKVIFRGASLVGGGLGETDHRTTDGAPAHRPELAESHANQPPAPDGQALVAINSEAKEAAHV